MIRKFFKWVFRAELIELKNREQELKVKIELTEQRLRSADIVLKRTENLLGGMSVSVDHNKYAPSWAVISIQGKRADYIKFVSLPDNDIKAIGKFVEQFDRKRRTVDSPLPYLKNKFFKI